jgi:hypothetical protein
MPISRSPPYTILHIRKEEFEPVAQISHARVRVPLQFKPLWDDLDGPIHQFGVLPCLEAQIEVSGILGIDAKLVH